MASDGLENNLTMAKILTSEVANSYLAPQELKIGGWCEVADLRGKPRWIQGPHCARMTARELANFSQHVAGWLGKGDWKILQLDNSSSLVAHESLLLSTLLLGSEQHMDPAKNRTFLFDLSACRPEECLQTEIAISHIVYLLLLWEAHGYLVCSGGAPGERLGIQDGFVIFYGSDVRLHEATTLLAEFEAKPDKPAKWIDVADADGQDPTTIDNDRTKFRS